MKKATAVAASQALSPASWLATKSFGAVRYLSFWALLRFLFGRRSRVFLFRSEFTPDEVKDVTFSLKRSRWIDGYVLFWTLISAVVFASIDPTAVSSLVRLIVYVLAAIRLLELFQAPLNTLVFDIHRGRVDSKTASSSRLLVLTMLNAVEFALWFAALYALNLGMLADAKTHFDALYFSVITQFTVGFGDIRPTGWLKLLTILQVIGGFILAVIVLARAVTTLPAMKGLLDEKDPADGVNSSEDR